MQGKSPVFIALLTMLQIIVLATPTLSEESTSNIGGHSTSSDSPVMMIDKEAYSIGESVPVTVVDHTANSNPNNIESIKVRAVSMIDREGLLVELLEDGPNTGIFKGILFLTDEGTSRNDTLRVSPGERFRILYENIGVTGIVWDNDTQSSEYDLLMFSLALIVIGTLVTGAFFGTRRFLLQRLSKRSYAEYLLLFRSSSSSLP
jgi:hypothetical protein